jgi:hypothetical protein
MAHGGSRVAKTVPLGAIIAGWAEPGAELPEQFQTLWAQRASVKDDSCRAQRDGASSFTLDVRFWHKADITTAPTNVRFWG